MSHPHNDNEEPLSEVNVIPLADLSLVLLIILMVLTPMISQALIQVTAAKANAAQTREEMPLEKPETPVIVSLEPGAIKLNGEVFKSELAFAGKLEAVMMTRRDRSVNLTAAPVVRHGDVVHIMDIVQRHGAKELVMLKWDPQAPAGGGAN